jgi:hypothetical protein
MEDPCAYMLKPHFPPALSDFSDGLLACVLQRKVFSHKHVDPHHCETPTKYKRDPDMTKGEKA